MPASRCQQARTTAVAWLAPAAARAAAGRGGEGTALAGPAPRYVFAESSANCGEAQTATNSCFRLTPRWGRAPGPGALPDAGHPRWRGRADPRSLLLRGLRAASRARE